MVCLGNKNSRDVKGKFLKSPIVISRQVLELFCLIFSRESRDRIFLFSQVSLDGLADIKAKVRPCTRLGYFEMN